MAGFILPILTLKLLMVVCGNGKLSYMAAPYYKLVIEVDVGPDGKRYTHPKTDPSSAGLQGVFLDWGYFPESLQELKNDALMPPTDKLEWAGDTVVIKFDGDDLKLYGNFAILDGLNPEPTVITRANFVELIDQWLSKDCM